MSYILDALKKSDMQARQGELPSIHSSHDLPDAGQRQSSWRVALISVLLSLLFVSLAYALLPVNIFQQNSDPDPQTNTPSTPPGIMAATKAAPPLQAASHKDPTLSGPESKQTEEPVLI
ncbi:MAG: hypothetical protein Q9M30_05890, partial [Mariprofundaceae bacterium]|nr:hypothetical protein [Mariprofundaceae bacterium]